MKLSDSACKIIGAQLGEVTLNYIRVDLPPVKAKFALINKEGETCGFMEIGHDWSEKVVEAARVFSEVLEEDALRRIFEQKEQVAEPSTQPNEPPQF